MSSPAPASAALAGAPAAPQQALARAFVTFSEAATSLEHSYEQLQNQIGRLRAELQQASAELEKERESARRLQALAEVSAMLAHELRNPLGSMELFASLLAQSQLPAPQNAWIQHIQAGLRGLAASVNNVLQLHAEANPNLVVTDVGELLHWAVEFLAPLAQQSEVSISVRNELVGVRIPADAHGLQQLILNLVLNAVHVLSPGGRVSLAGRRGEGESDWIELEVSDNGPGICAEHLERIFEAGFTTRAGGAGLGLAVVKKLVQQHGGYICVTSKVGQGTTFRVRLPGDKQ